MKEPLAHAIDRRTRDQKENQLIKEKRKQPGIGFPSAGKQEHLLIIRLNLARGSTNSVEVRKRLRQLCGLFARIDSGTKKIDTLDDGGNVERKSFSNFSFSATIGFGIGFFERLKIPEEKRPSKIREMPDHTGLGDVAQYTLAQTDLIIQLGATDDFINRWVLDNTVHKIRIDDKDVIPETKRGARIKVDNNDQGEDIPDIVTAIRGWATITDVHAGFQRIDGRNLQGFNDGVSNPRRLSPLFDEIVWTTKVDEDAALTDGTYMVFQKIEHDLEQWRQLELEEQEGWVGRKKKTGLLLGTLSEEEERKLVDGMDKGDPKSMARWKEEFDKQKDPENHFFDHINHHDPNSRPRHGQIPLKCPAWAHVRKANPRQEDGRFPRILMFRRGYPYIESGLNSKISSGLLFICFQKNIGLGFEFIKKNWLNNKNFPVPQDRPKFTNQEETSRHQQGRFDLDELRRMTLDTRRILGLADHDAFSHALEDANKIDTQNTGREGLAGPSELGVSPSGEFLAIVPLGGGYYFIPPIPHSNIADIGQQFF